MLAIKLASQRFDGVGHQLRSKIHENVGEVVIAVRNILENVQRQYLALA